MGWSKKSRLVPKNDMLGWLAIMNRMASNVFFGKPWLWRKKDCWIASQKSELAPFRKKEGRNCGNCSNFILLFDTDAAPLPSEKNKIMARVCQVTGKKPMTGHHVSHSNIKTKRRFNPNLQKKRFFLAEEDKWITLKVSADAIRTINKKGLFAVVKELRESGVAI